MTKNATDYFNAELRKLREYFDDFTQKHPEQAKRLSRRHSLGHDPDIDRLLEGVAFLTGQIEQRMDADLPELTQDLLQRYWPQLVAPFPAATILQFTPCQSRPLLVEKGTCVTSAAVGEPALACRFRTTQAIMLNPMAITGLEVCADQHDRTCLRLDLALKKGAVPSELALANLPIYLDADQKVALFLHWAFTQKLHSLAVLLPTSEGDQQYLRDQLTIAPGNLHSSSLLLPARPAQAHFHLLLDYFCFQEKYHFIEIQGLDKLTLPPACQKLSLEIILSTALPEGYRLQKEMFCLHCVPGVNLFTDSSATILADPQQAEYPLLLQAGDAEGLALHTVDRVIGRGRQGEEIDFTVRPVGRVCPPENNKGAHYYAVSHRKYPNGREQAILSIAGKPLSGKTALFAELTLSNASFPHRYLHAGDIGQLLPHQKNRFSVTNLTRPTPYYSPPAQQDFHWALLSQLSLNFNTLIALEGLKQTLSTYQWARVSQNDNRIAGIEHTSAKKITRFIHGQFFSGLALSVTVSESHYQSLQDIHLFGLVLHHFLSQCTPINVFLQTNIICQPSQHEFLWPATLNPQAVL